MTLERFPKDVVLLILGMLDPLSVIRFSLTSKKMQTMVSEEWLTSQLIKACHENPITQAIMKAAKIEKEFEKGGKLNVRQFFADVELNKAEQLKHLLQPYTFTLFHPCYNQPPWRDDFAFSKRHTYTLYLDPDLARKKIANASSVNHFHSIEVTPSKDDLDLSDIKKGIIRYKS